MGFAPSWFVSAGITRNQTPTPIRSANATSLLARTRAQEKEFKEYEEFEEQSKVNGKNGKANPDFFFPDRESSIASYSP